MNPVLRLRDSRSISALVEPAVEPDDFVVTLPTYYRIAPQIGNSGSLMVFMLQNICLIVIS